MDARQPTTEQPRPKSDLDVTTLVIAAVASAASAFVTSRVWPAGALWSAAVSPIIVALVKEALNRPAQRLRTLPQAVPVVAQRRGRRRSRPGRAELDLAELRRERTGEAPPRRGRPRWRLALVTGALAFAIVAVLYTVPELLAGESVGGGERRTTLFGGAARPSRDVEDDRGREAATPEPGTSAEPAPTATVEPGTDAEPTPTATPPAVPTPTPTLTPPPQATPAPTP